MPGCQPIHLVITPYRRLVVYDRKSSKRIWKWRCWWVGLQRKVSDSGMSLSFGKKRIFSNWISCFLRRCSFVCHDLLTTNHPQSALTYPPSLSWFKENSSSFKLVFHVLAPPPTHQQLLRSARQQIENSLWSTKGISEVSVSCPSPFRELKSGERWNNLILFKSLKYLLLPTKVLFSSPQKHRLSFRLPRRTSVLIWQKKTSS